MRSTPKVLCQLAAFCLILNPILSAATIEERLQALEAQVASLTKENAALKKQTSGDAKDAAAAAKAAPKIAITDKGFSFASGDAANSVSIRGLVQFDSRMFFGDGGGIVNNAFVLRRARPIIEGTFNKIYSFQFVSEFGGTGTPSILDANLGVALSKSVQFRFGKFKVPVGLEWLQSDSWTFFDERSIATDLVPNRDLGMQVGGSFNDGAITYAVGIFNGVADGTTTTNSDFDNEKDVAGRLYLQPFKSAKNSPLQGLAFGVGASLGREKTASALTGGYKTDGQQTFFKYRSTVVADGKTWRISPQAEYRTGPFGAMGEYMVSTVNVRPTATGVKTELQNKAWQLAAGYVLTGEKSSFTGVAPNHPFSWEQKNWGAWEVAVRYANLKIDDHAFPLFADSAVSANEATSLGLGLNWYLSKAVRVSFDFYQTQFDTKVAVPTTQILRQDEQALISRFQISF
jgi:phosphate-selective porin OprO/OprP